MSVRVSTICLRLRTHPTASATRSSKPAVIVAGVLHTGMACSGGNSPLFMYCRYTLEAGKMKSSISSWVKGRECCRVKEGHKRKSVHPELTSMSCAAPAKYKTPCLSNISQKVAEKLTVYLDEVSASLFTTYIVLLFCCLESQ